MKNYSIVFILLLSFFNHAQISYDFGAPVPPSGELNISLSPMYYGVYSNPSSPVAYEISSNGIFIITTNITAISRETIRESSKYQVRNNHIFGVHEEDSIPCVLEGENYYFGIKNKDQIVGGFSKNQLIQQSANEYILNFEENGKYVPMFIKITPEGLAISQFDYTSDTKGFKKIDKKVSVQKDIEFITLYPTVEEWKKLKLNEFQTEAIIYKR